MEYPLVITLPIKFYADHKRRNLPSGEMIKVLNNQVIVKLDTESFQDLLADAKHYAFEMDYAEPREYLSLTRSAKRTYEILKGLI